MFPCRFHMNNLEPYVTSSELMPGKFTLDPPEGFTDTLNNKAMMNITSCGGGKADDGTTATTTTTTAVSDGGMKGHGKSHQQGSRTQVKANNEYAIAV